MKKNTKLGLRMSVLCCFIFLLYQNPYWSMEPDEAEEQ